MVQTFTPYTFKHICYGGALLALMHFFSCHPEERPSGTLSKDTLSSSANYQIVPVKRKKLIFPIRGSGRLELQQEKYLSFKVGGIIRSIYADKGARITQGQLLAQIDTEEFQERYRQAQENYQRIGSNLERSENLYKQNIGTFQDLEDLRASYEIAESNLEIASQALRDASLFAPNTGIVLEKYQEIGEIASPGKAVFKISGPGEQYIFEAALSDEQVVKVNLGDSCLIRLSTYGQAEFNGRVSRISTSPDQNTNLYTVEISFNPGKIDLRPGYIGDVLIYGRQEQSYAFIPPQALIEADKYQALVYIKGPKEELKAIQVKIAHILDDEIAIAQGLEGVQEVIIP